MVKNSRLLAGKPLRCRVIPVTHVRQNCSIIWCGDTLRGAVVDPGGEVDRLVEEIQALEITVEQLLITHCHPDHAGAATPLARHLDIPVVGPHRAEAPGIAGVADNAAKHGFPEFVPFQPDRWLADGDRVQVGKQEIRAIHCPGHTPGHMAYFAPASNLAFVGDILFKGAIGWTSCPENTRQLLHSIRKKLFPLGEHVVFVPGHEGLSTFGEERLLNPYVSDLAAEDYEHLLAAHSDTPA